MTHIQSISIRNIMGIGSLDVVPVNGKVTLAHGKNGTGKSSFVTGLQTAFGAQAIAPAQLIREGAEKGETVVILTDGTTINRQVSDTGTKVKVTDANGLSHSKPQTVIDSLYNVTQFNPIKLLDTDKASRDARLRAVMECMPIKVTAEMLLEVAPMLASQIGSIDVSKHGLDVIDIAYKKIFEARTDKNRAVKEASMTVVSLKETLVDVPSDLESTLAQIEDLKSKISALQAKRNAYNDEFENERRGLREKALQVANESISSAAAVRDEAIRSATIAYETELAKINEAKDNTLQLIEASYTEKREAKARAFEDRHTPLMASLGQLEEQSRNAVGAAKQREIIADMQKKNDALALEADAMTAALDRLKALRTKLASEMPIPGLEVRENEIYFDGRAWDTLNTAKRIAIAVELAAIRSGKLGVICVDGCEALDSESFELLADQCSKRGLQLFATRVDDEAFTIETLDLAEVA
ncbi:MAG: hypothetical protein JSS89_13145 [Bacteroidetes bacterium]|nr:hypothetical protein [Bacteroidota bacterium]